MPNLCKRRQVWGAEIARCKVNAFKRTLANADASAAEEKKEGTDRTVHSTFLNRSIASSTFARELKAEMRM